MVTNIQKKLMVVSKLIISGGTLDWVIGFSLTHSEKKESNDRNQGEKNRLQTAILKMREKGMLHLQEARWLSNQTKLGVKLGPIFLSPAELAAALLPPIPPKSLPAPVSRFDVEEDENEILEAFFFNPPHSFFFLFLVVARSDFLFRTLEGAQ